MKALPIPEIIPSQFSGRDDRRRNKADALNAIIQTGSVREAIASGEIDRVTLTRYLLDGEFSEKLKLIEHHIAARMTTKAMELAEKGSERMIEYVNNALNPQFDPVTRKETARARGVIGSMIFKQLLGETEEPDHTSMTDKTSYRALEHLTGVQDADIIEDDDKPLDVPTT